VFLAPLSLRGSPLNQSTWEVPIEAVTDIEQSIDESSKADEVRAPQ
jgi:hypothetical protein